MSYSSVRLYTLRYYMRADQEKYDNTTQATTTIIYTVKNKEYE